MQSNPQIQAGTILLTKYPLYIPILQLGRTVYVVLGDGLWAKVICNISETEHRRYACDLLTDTQVAQVYQHWTLNDYMEQKTPYYLASLSIYHEQEINFLCCCF